MLAVAWDDAVAESEKVVKYCLWHVLIVKLL